ncbi:flagellar biosynthesis protein FlhF [Neobacillus cucumis]|uniref:Flagellar biosynthesis protein FlhF n=1 Tax=Neobacillus cucumis TaxID=1740721 RepID=A0A2N5H7I1_9BACI|nr:flagellar biosynthesis protein FlhF [Neobacillus cucumis]PLS01470.1 flagellar biosynthesis protein FlhF [Neobacillus cucumis]
MKIKRYMADTLPQAISLIRMELGENAVILNKKVVTTGGFLGLFKRKQIEVIAASEASERTTVKKAPIEERPTASAETEVLQRLNQMEQLLGNLLKNQQPFQLQKTSVLTKWLELLEEQEVDQEVIDYIVKKIMSQHPLIERLTEQEAGQIVLSTITKLFQDAALQEGLDPHATLITLLGPTGVGKTTTIAKLASRQVLFQRKKVGFLTADTFRMAAIEQLKTYANILNIPIGVVESSEQLPQSLMDLKNCQMIFMDSTGRNYLEEQYIEEIQAFLEQDFKQENHLVLSITSRWKDMKQIVEKMKSVQVDRVILTKWDESTCFGAALNLVYHYPYPLSFISLGQGVPEDIMLAEPEYMAKKILGVDEDEEGSGTKIERIVSAL